MFVHSLLPLIFSACIQLSTPFSQLGVGLTPRNHPIFDFRLFSTSVRRPDQAMLDALAEATPGQDAIHIFHGRGGCYEGCEHLTVDWYPPVWVITSFNQTTTEADLKRWGDVLEQRWEELGSGQELCWIYQDRSVSPTQTTLMAGTMPDPHVVHEGKSKYLVHVLKGQNHGLFLDMANGRSWVHDNAENGKVLNLFSYTCSFSVAALQGGANTVVNIDMSGGALKIGQRNHDLNDFGKGGGARFLKHDIFKSWGKLKKSGPYDIIVSDPPSYQKGSFVAKRDYIKIIRRLPTLLVPGGHALLCLNAPELDCQFLQDQLAEGAPELRFIERIENPETYPSAFPERALKVLLYQLPEESEDATSGAEE